MAEPVCVETSIASVEVYRSQALVRRTARLELAAGAREGAFRLRGLPYWLEDDSVRVRILEGGGRVGDLHLELDVAERGGAQWTGAQEELRARERERAALVVERGRHAELVALLEGIVPVAPEPLPDEIACRERHPARAALGLTAFSRGRVLEARGRMRSIDRDLRGLDDRIAAAREALARRDSEERERLRAVRKAARVGIEAPPDAAALTLELSYLVPGAAWVPEYVLRVAEGRDEAELVVHAVVGQLTGESWPPVPLAFSTADLARSTALPKLESWRIGRAQPPRRSGWRELPDAVDELLADYERSRPDVVRPEPPALAPLPRGARMEELVAEELEAHGDRERRGGTPVAGAVLRKRDSRAPPPPRPPSTSAPAYAREAPPPASMMPAAMPAAPEPTRSRRSARVEEVAEEVERSSAAYEAYDQKELAPDEGGAAPGPVGIAASRTALAYGALRMRGPADSEGRGRLEGASLLDELRERGGGEAIPDDVAPSLVLAPPGCVPLQHSAGHFAARFESEARVAIPSDGGGHQVTLARRSGPVERLLVCTPGRGPEVHELATFRNPLEVPLLAGPARVFRGGDFVVEALLATHAPGQPLTVNLGVEPGVVVARNVQFQESTGGLLGGATVLAHRIELELRSRLPRPVKVKLLERVPVSDDPEVKVELKRGAQRFEPYDQSDRGEPVRGGLATWVELAPRETKQVLLEYQVTIPARKALVGGNRRD
jgi:hypothetical protein